MTQSVQKIVSCWICGDVADSREHRIKKTDLKESFGDFSQSKPIFISTDGKLNKPAGSLKSDRLKFGKNICRLCNGTLTQPYDLAWGSLSNALANVIKSNPAVKTLKASKVFSLNARIEMLRVHLFFLKWLGCCISEEGYSFDQEAFSLCLRMQKPHPQLFISFGISTFPNALGDNGIATVSDDDNRKIIRGNYFYFAGRQIVVNVILAGLGERLIAMDGAWHPSHNTTKLTIRRPSFYESN